MEPSARKSTLGTRRYAGKELRSLRTPVGAYRCFRYREGSKPHVWHARDDRPVVSTEPEVNKTGSAIVLTLLETAHADLGRIPASAMIRLVLSSNAKLAAVTVGDVRTQNGKGAGKGDGNPGS